jgi:UDP-N-acetylmuramate--alanine ligase
MLARVAIDAGMDPTIVVGTLVDFLGGSNARLGGSDLLVAESDESDGSFLELAPVFSVITNIDREHLDHYGDYAAVLDAFAAFANKAPWYGAVAACADDPGVRSILPRVRRRVVLYGSAPDSRLRIGALEAGGDGSRFRMALDGRDLGEFRLRVAGVHNVLNAAAAAAIAIEIGVPPAAIASSLEAFGGSGRRMEAKGSARGVSVIDDYGHHPAEVRATLEALRLGRPRRLVVLFQPHRYTRTAALLDEFAGAFGAADLVRVTDLYAASEEPIAGVDARALAERIRSAGHSDCRYAGPLDQAVEDLARELTGGDLVVTLGAGSVTEAGPRILDALRRESRHG